MKRTTCFFLFFIPCVFWWFFVLYIIFGNFEFHAEPHSFLETLKEGANIFHSIESGIFKTIIMVIAFPLVVLYYVLWGIVTLFTIPVYFFIDGFYFCNLLICLAIIVFILTFIGALKFKLGSFQQDSSHITGSHYEADVNSDGKIIVKEVEERSGGGEWIINMFLLFFRMIVIAVCGAILYFKYTKTKK